MFVWDERKGEANLVKHGLNLADAGLVYDNPAKITIRSDRRGEERYADIAYVEAAGRVLTLVYVERGGDIRVISFRKSAGWERELYAEESREPY